MTAAPRTSTSLRARLAGGRVGRADQARQQFLDKPYASVQMLMLASVGLLLFGVLMAVSTTISAVRDDGSSVGGSIWGQAVKEAEFILLGLVLFWFAMRLSPRMFRALTYPVLAIALVGLLAVLVPGVGVQINDARRWIDVGPVQVQPSEFAKFAILLWGADLLARKQQLGTLRRARHLFLPLLPGFAVVVALVMAEPDLGTTLCFMLILLGLLWMIGMPLRYFSVVLVSVAGVVALLAVAAPYRLQRLVTFTDPFKDAKGSGYHTVEGLYALASGGLFGVGLGQGTSKYGYVPNANSDYVFAVIGEELGFIGCVAVLALFALFAYVGMRVVRRSADPFVRLAGGTATIWICGQAVINIGYVSGLLPVTGIPLPLISAGGTSLLVTFFVLGMLTSFARHEREAVNACRRAERLGRRTRLERWAAIPVPKPYVAPKKRRQGQDTTTRPTTGTTKPATGSRGATPNAMSARAKSPSARGETVRASAARRGPERRTAPSASEGSRRRSGTDGQARRSGTDG